jgi:hypothetical protein
MMAKLRPFLLPLALAILAILVYNTRVRHEMVDFTIWRQAAVRGLQAQPLYRPEDGHYQFKYFPVFALMMAPFAVLDQDTAKMIWFAVSFGLLAAFLRWSIAALPERRQSERTLLWLAIVLMAKFFAHELLLGQTNLLLGALLVAGLLALQIDQPAMAGGLIGVAAFVKPYALVMLPWLLVTQGVAAGAMAAGILATGLLLPAMVYGWIGNRDLLLDWYRTVSNTTAPNLLGNDNVSIAAMWAKWIGPGPLASILTAMSVALLLALVVIVCRKRRAISTPEYLEFALLMLLIPLLSPQGWDYVLLLATPAVILLLDRWREVGRGWQVALGLALVLMCLTMFDVMGRSLYGRFMALSIVTVSALGVAAGLAHLRWRTLA